MLLHDSFQEDESLNLSTSSSNNLESIPSFSRFTIFQKVDNINGTSEFIIVTVFSSIEDFSTAFIQIYHFPEDFFQGLLMLAKILPNPSPTCPTYDYLFLEVCWYKTQSSNLHHSHLPSME